MPVYPFEEVGREELHWLHAYWTKMRGDAAMPRRAEIDPLDMPKLLPSLSIIDRHEGAYRIRLVGSKLADIYGRDLTGTVVGPEIFGNMTGYWISIHDRLFMGEGPLFGTDRFHWSDRDHVTFDWGAFPLADDSGAVSHELWCLIFKDFS